MQWICKIWGHVWVYSSCSQAIIWTHHHCWEYEVSLEFNFTGEFGGKEKISCSEFEEGEIKGPECFSIVSYDEVATETSNCRSLRFSNDFAGSEYSHLRKSLTMAGSESGYSHAGKHATGRCVNTLCCKRCTVIYLGIFKCNWRCIIKNYWFTLFPLPTHLCLVLFLANIITSYMLYVDANCTY